MQKLTIAKNGGKRSAEIVGNIGNQFNLEPLTGDSSTDSFLVLGLYIQKLCFSLSKSTITYSDWFAILIVIKLFLEVA